MLGCFQIARPSSAPPRSVHILRLSCFRLRASHTFLAHATTRNHAPRTGTRTLTRSTTAMTTPTPAQTPTRATATIPPSATTASTPGDGPKSRILVLGAGNFGSCLADHLGDSNHDAFLWSRDAELVRHFNLHRKNIHYLKDHLFSENIEAVGPELPDRAFIEKVNVILFAIPTQGLRDLLTALRSRIDETNPPLLIFVNKGIEIGTQALTLEIIADTCGRDVARVATFISGPSFANEIVQRQPTSVSVASLSEEHAKRASLVFHRPWFRCYTSSDPVGLELAGALKNVYAMAAGMSVGLGYENNTRAMLITRGLNEMTRIGVAYGASPLTFLGLAGVGDLFLTCSSPTSRNYTVGYRLGRGEPLETIVGTLGSVAEGVTTVRSVKKIIEELDLRAPIATCIYQVLYEGKNVADAVQELMCRPPGRELNLPEKAGGPARQLMLKLGIDHETHDHS